jgi:hypothetical protein
MYTITCTIRHGKYWDVGDAFAADTARVEDDRLVGRDIDGRKFNLPAAKFACRRS